MEIDNFPNEDIWKGEWIFKILQKEKNQSLDAEEQIYSDNGNPRNLTAIFVDEE